MAKDRLAPCMFYIRHGECTKGRVAEHKSTCQTCNKYRPRKGYKAPVNKKKQAKLDNWGR